MTPIKKFCESCDSPMEVGERVSVLFVEEQRVKAAIGFKVVKQCRSILVCRKCAEKAKNLLGVSFDD